MVGPNDPPESSRKIKVTNFDDPLYLHLYDNSITTIINFKLNGSKNYWIWKISMFSDLKARSKNWLCSWYCD